MILEIDALTTGYAKAPVLRDVSLCVGDEVVAVLGANGAGKTTLLRAISGHVKQWSGSVNWTGTPWHRARTGLEHVPEVRHAFGAMSVQDNLDVAALTGKGRSFTSEDVYDIFPRLRERRTQLAASLSGGEQQMLVIGRALMTAPRLLLVDEMSAGLAPVTARLLVGALRGIRARGVSVLLVEQSPQLIADLVDRVYVLERGEIAAAGTMDEIGGVDGLRAMYLAAR